MKAHSMLARLFVFGLLAMSLVGCSAILPASAQPLQYVANASQAGGPSQPAVTDQVIQTPQAASQGITVVGSGQASGTPDMVQISVGVQTQNQNVQQAVSDNAAQMNKLLATLKSSGIAEKDIRTSNYSVSLQQPPVAPTPDGKGAVSGQVTYLVNNQVDVTLRDVSKLGSVLDQVVASGANNIFGVNFGISDPSKLQESARSSAMKDAAARAQSLAQLAGVSLGNILSITENVTNSGPMPYYAAGMGTGGATPIQPGQLQVTETVQVTYAIK
jgi:uncharacterized protein